MRFDDLRPANWEEELSTTLDVIEHEAKSHSTESLVRERITYANQYWRTDTPPPAEVAVSKLRARAVVLAQEVERLQAALAYDNDDGRRD